MSINKFVYLYSLFQLLIFTNQYQTSTPNNENNTYFSSVLWVTFDTELSSIYLIFGKNNYPARPSRLFIDLGSNISSINESFSYNLTSNPQHSQSLDEVYSLNGKALIQDDLYSSDTSNFQLEHFPFQLIKPLKKQVYSQGYLSLSKSPNSITNLLYTQNVIAKRMIMITHWEITFGGYSTRLANLSSIIHHVPLVDYQLYWALQLKGLILSDSLSSSLKKNQINTIDAGLKYLSLNSILILKTIEYQYMYLPYALYNHFISVYFADEVKQGLCMANEPLNDEVTFECNCYILYKRKIYLVFDEVLVRLNDTYIKLFKRDEENICVYPIIFMKNLNVAIMGRRYIQDFNLVLNQDGNYVGFLETIPSYLISNIKEEKGGIKSNYNRCLLIAVIIILSIGIVILGIKLYKVFGIK